MIVAGVADLAAGLGVERRLVDQDRDRLRRPRRVCDRLAVDDERDDLALGRLGVVAEELGRAEPSRSSNQTPLGRRLARAGPGARALGRCSAIAASKPAVSTAVPRPRSTSAVRSSGKP